MAMLLGQYARRLPVFVLVILSHVTFALPSDPSVDLDPKAFTTDEGSTAALDAIAKLQISRSPLLNESAREEAQNAIAAYTADINQLNILLSRGTTDVDNKAKGFFDTLETSVAPCQAKIVASLQGNLAGLYNYVAESHSFLQRVLTPDTPFG